MSTEPMPLPKSIPCKACDRSYPEGWKRCPFCGYDETRERRENASLGRLKRRLAARGISLPETGEKGRARPKGRDQRRRGGKPGVQPQRGRGAGRPQPQGTPQPAETPEGQAPAPGTGRSRRARQRRRKRSGPQNPQQPQNQQRQPQQQQKPRPRPSPRPGAEGAPPSSPAPESKQDGARTEGSEQQKRRRRRFRRRRSGGSNGGGQNGGGPGSTES